MIRENKVALEDAHKALNDLRDALSRVLYDVPWKREPLTGMHDCSQLVQYIEHSCTLVRTYLLSYEKPRPRSCDGPPGCSRFACGYAGRCVESPA